MPAPVTYLRERKSIREDLYQRKVILSLVWFNLMTCQPPWLIQC